MEKRKRAKGISMVLLLMMVLQLVMPVNFAYGNTVPSEDTDINVTDKEGKDIPEGADDLSSDVTSGTAILFDMPIPLSGGKDLGDIFTFESMTIDDDPVADGEVITIEDGTVAKIRFKWDTKEKNAEAGDTASIQLSDVFKLAGPFPDGDIKVGNEIVGIYNIVDGKLTFIFNDKIANGEVKNGYVELGLKFDLEKFKEDVKQTIPFAEGNTNNINIVARPNLNHSGITKLGTPDNTQNAKFINWSIDVVNTSEDEIKNATVGDTLPPGVKEAKDFVIEKLTVGIDGSLHVSEVTTMNPTTFPINLGNMDAFSGYRIKFKTDINYSTAYPTNGSYSFENNATFNYDGLAKELPAKATVGNLKRSNPIEKSGVKKSNSKDRVQWTIDVNKSGQIVSNAIVEDTLPKGHKVDVSTIKINKITQNGNNWTVGAEHPNSVIDETGGFPIGLGKLTANDAYRITFETVIDWSEVGDEYLKNNSFENTAELYDSDNKVGSDDATVSFTRDPILEKKGTSKVDYNNKTIEWTVTVNKAKHPFTGLVVTDYLPAGLKLIGPVTVTSDVKGETYASYTTSSAIVSDGVDDGKTELKINLNDVDNRMLTIKYVTEVDNFNTINFANAVGMDGTGVGNGGEPIISTVKPVLNTYVKSEVDIDYAKKEMSWQISVAAKKEGIQTGFVITDTFTNDGLILLPETVNVMLGTAELVKDTDYVLAPITKNYVTGYQNGFTITFNRVIDGGELVVTYTTSYDPEKLIEIS